MNNLLVFLILVVLSITSCAPVYIPSAPLVFNNEEEGDYFVALRQGSFSTNLQGGYAVNDNFNIGGSVSALYTGDASVASTSYEGSNAAEVNLVAGYYNKFTATHIFELNGGVGPVFLQSADQVSDYFKGYVQPSITFVGNGRKKTNLTLLTRFVGATFNEEYSNQPVRDSVVNLGYIEPAMSFSIGNAFKFNSQLGLSLPMGGNNSSYNVSPFIFNIGIAYAIPRKRTSTLP